jgi:hypothetical protein
MADNNRSAPKRRTLRPEDDPYPPAWLRRRIAENKRAVLAASGPDDPRVRALMADTAWLIRYQMALGARTTTCQKIADRYYERDADGVIQGIRRGARSP